MKVFQIVNDFCYYDATPVHPNIASVIGKYPPDVLFVEAPDFVFEGWGYDETKEGNERFVMPTPPVGWNYDPKSGTFYPEEEAEPEVEPEDPVLALQKQVADLQAQIEFLMALNK